MRRMLEPGSAGARAGEGTVANVLWTGGWDSTFRILQLAMIERRPVQPHYIIDTRRPSSIREIRAMADIRDRVGERDPDAARRIRPAIITSIDDIDPDPGISASYRQLLREGYLGFQYTWLACYIRQNGLDDLELCVHLDDRAESFLRGKVVLVRDERSGDGYRRLADEHETTDLRIFHGFQLPILGMSKVEMRDIAERAGFLDILESSWFCFTPVRGKPCGCCNPCTYAIEEGMSYRLPTSAILRRRVRGARRISIRFRRARRRSSIRMRRAAKRVWVRAKRRAKRTGRRARGRVVRVLRVVARALRRLVRRR